ncbi:hypothetical protein J1N35_044691 [Gossypium stocksii]|uniref:Reverse transcriptase domain-containing protein n=1 Tax=Gossypium stocksii TaxID=47602 RepID=A0A9D3U9R4_9ROSI|nr:hypothetical protein J1N35_044691 [Gossypium stocksii]
MANLCLVDEEEVAYQEDPKASDHDLQFYLVGTCLMDIVVHFPSPQNTMRLLLIVLMCFEAILRLRILMPHISIWFPRVHEAQGAFVQSRQIFNNVLVTYEIIQILKSMKWGKKGNFALKLNICKAYNKVEWDFLAVMMLRLRFHADWVALMMRYVASVTYTIGINGGYSGSFVPSMGLSQGDPLNPYLFLLCAKGLSMILVNAQEENFLRVFV